MTIETIKFSEFISGGDLNPNEVIVGLDATSTINTSFTTFPMLPPGTTADRPAAASTMYYRLRFNTTIESYEYYSPVLPGWIQLSDSEDVIGVIGTANQVLANGTSGTLETGAVTLTTPQDIDTLADVQFGSVQFNTNDAILDLNGALMIGFVPTGGAVNYFTFSNKATGSKPVISVAGADAAIGMRFETIGGSQFNFVSTADSPLVVISSTNVHTSIIDFPTTNTTHTYEFPAADGTVCILDPVLNVPTNGFIPIGNGTAFNSAALTAGSGISIVNASGSVTISSSTSGMSWSTTTVSVNPVVVGSGYVANSAGLLTFTLPATAAVGDMVSVEGLGAGGWVLTANTGQTIKLGPLTTSSGGSLASVLSSDNVYVTCVVANTTWRVRTTNSTGLTIT